VALRYSRKWSLIQACFNVKSGEHMNYIGTGTAVVGVMSVSSVEAPEQSVSGVE